MRALIFLSFILPVKAGFLGSVNAALGIVNGGLELHCWATRCKSPPPPPGQAPKRRAPPFSGQGDYWKARKSEDSQRGCSGRIKIEVPKYIYGDIQGDNRFPGTRRNWTVRLGRGRDDITKNSGASGSYKRIRQVRGSTSTSCRNGHYESGSLPPSCHHFNAHNEYWDTREDWLSWAGQTLTSAFTFMSRSGTILGHSGVQGHRHGPPLGPPSETRRLCTDSANSQPPEDEDSSGPYGKYDRDVNGGYGHPMCDDENSGYEDRVTVPCRASATGCPKRPLRNLWSVYKDETQGNDENEDSESPDEFFIFALGDQEYAIQQFGVGAIHNIANDHERLIPQHGGDGTVGRIQIKRVRHETISRTDNHGFEYVKNVYPNHSLTIDFWDKIIGQAHLNGRFDNWDKYLTNNANNGNGNGLNSIQFQGTTRATQSKEEKFCKRKPGFMMHHLTTEAFGDLDVQFGRKGGSPQRLLRWCDEKVAARNARLNVNDSTYADEDLYYCDSPLGDTSRWWNKRRGQCCYETSEFFGTITNCEGRTDNTINCLDMENTMLKNLGDTGFYNTNSLGVSAYTVRDYNNFDLQYTSENEFAGEEDNVINYVDRGHCVTGGAGWYGSFNNAPNLNEDAPTEAWSEYEGCPEDARVWKFYVCDENTPGDCEDRPRTPDHAIEWTARKEDPTEFPSAGAQQRQSDGYFETYPFVIPMREDEEPYPAPNSNGTVVNFEYEPENYYCYNGEATWWDTPGDRVNLTEATKKDCSYFDQLHEGRVIRVGINFKSANGVQRYNPTIYDTETNVNGSIMPSAIKFNSEIHENNTMSRIFALDPDTIVDACCGLGGGTLGTQSPTEVVPVTPGPPPPPPVCYDRVGKFKYDSAGTWFDHAKGCDALLDRIPQSLFFNGSFSLNSPVQEGDLFWNWLCTETSYYGTMFDCTNDDITNGDCTEAIPRTNFQYFGLKLGECCICGGSGVQGRTEPVTNSPTTSSPTQSPTTCAEAFSLTVPFFHDRLHMLRNDQYSMETIRNVATNNLVGSEAGFEAEFVEYASTYYRTMGNEFFAPDQGQCNARGAFGLRGACADYFPKAKNYKGRLLRPQDFNGITSLDLEGRDFFGANTTFTRSSQLMFNRPVYESNPDSVLGGYIIAHVQNRWVLANSRAMLQSGAEFTAQTLPTTKCVEESRWFTRANLMHTLDTFNFPGEDNPVHVVKADSFMAEWPFDFAPQAPPETLFDAPVLECAETLIVGADHQQFELLWSGAFRGAIGEYRKTRRRQNSRPVWVKNNIDHRFNWHIYHVNPQEGLLDTTGRWVIDDDDDYTNGIGDGAFLGSLASCPEDVASLRQWQVSGSDYGGINMPGQYTWQSLDVTSIPDEEDDDSVGIYVGIGVGSAVLLAGLLYKRSAIITLFSRSSESIVQASLLEAVF